MGRVFSSAAAPGRWRRRRTARIAVAVALVLAAPVVIRSEDDVAGGPSPPGDQRKLDHSLVRVVPVPLADPAVADLLKPGDLVDLVGVVDRAPEPGHVPELGPELGPDPASPAGHVVVARAARVRDTPAGRTGSRTILVEVPEADAARLAATAAGTPLAVVVHG